MTIHRFLIPAIFAVAGQGFLAQSARADEQPDLSQIYIKSINAIGSGCADPSTYSVNLSDDHKAFTLSFSEFVAVLGQGISPLEGRKNCSITLTLNIPAGFQYSIGTFNYRGYMDLDRNVQADHTTSYFFQGTGDTGKFVATVKGPVSKDFVYTDKLGLTSAYIPDVWSPCNVDRALTINPSVRLTKLAGAAADAQGLITNDTVDGEINQVFGLKYRRCGQTPTPPPIITPVPDPDPIPMPQPIDLKPGAVYNLVSRNSGKCLDVFDHGTANGVRLQQWACTGEDHQKFRIVLQPDSRYSLQAVPSGRFVTVGNSSQDNGAAIVIWDNQNGANQKLSFEKTTDNSYMARFNHSQKCLDVSDVSLNDGAIVHQWECLNGANQQWFFREVAAPQPQPQEAIYTLTSRRSGKCLDVFDHGTANGVRLQQWACTGEPHQKFRLKPAADGTFALIGVASGRAVDVGAASQENGAAIVQWDYTGAANQRVRLVDSVNGSKTVRFVHSGKCLDVSDLSYADGAVVHQWECVNGDNQDWYLNKQ